VTFRGVPIGRVETVGLDPHDAGRVDIVFALSIDRPLRVGTTASLSRAAFDGTATVNLDGALDKAPLLVAVEGTALPEVPARKGSVTAQDPATIITRVYERVDQLTDRLSPIGQKRISEKLARADIETQKQIGQAERIGSAFSAAPKRLGDLDRTLVTAAAKAERLRSHMHQSELLKTFKDARPSPAARIANFGAAINRVRPRLRAMSSALPKVTRKTRALDGIIEPIGKKLEALDSGGIASFSPRLPSYRSRINHTDPPRQ